MDKPTETNMLIMWQTPECNECRRAITQLAKLAASQNDTQIAIVDCQLNNQLCKTWVQHQQETQTPYLLLVRDKKVYKYDKVGVQADLITEWLLSQDKTMVSDNLIAYVVEGEKSHFNRKDKQPLED